MLLNSWITRRLLTAQVEDVTIIRMAIESPTCLNRIPVPPYGAEYIQRRRRDCHIPVKSSVRILPRRRNLWVTATIQRRARSPRTRCGIAQLRLFPVGSQLPFETVY